MRRRQAAAAAAAGQGGGVKEDGKVKEARVVPGRGAGRPAAPTGTSWRRQAEVAAWCATFVAFLFIARRVLHPPPDPALTPHTGRRITQLPQFGGTHAASLLWGTYRPHLYLGIRPRLARSLVAGLMWFDPQRPGGELNLRHECEEGDHLDKYGWVRHDGRGYARQHIRDGDYTLTTHFIKPQREDDTTTTSPHHWAVRVQAESSDTSVKRELSILFYVGDETGYPADVSAARRKKNKKKKGANKDVALVMKSAGDDFAHGVSAYFGNWTLSVADEGVGGRVRYAGVNTMHFHNFTQLVQGLLHERAARVNRLELPNTASHGNNVAIYQLTAELPFTLDISFSNNNNLPTLSGESLTALIQAQETAFDERFEKTFGLREREGVVTSDEMVELGKAALSNLLGGIGYFYGSSVVAKAKGDTGGEVYEYGPYALFTATPSRSFFPRGFLWDEGFHHLLIRRWDPALSRDILAHWLDLMNQQGWIAREQILGDEARRRVPAEFVVQRTSDANPPTLFLPLSGKRMHMARGMTAGDGDIDDADFLSASFSRLAAWYKWFNTTQTGPEPGSYRWRGRKHTNVELNAKTLTSGLDDYPRASHPSDIERHVDLRCWMALASSCMADIALASGTDINTVDKYIATAARLADISELDRLQLHEQKQMYFDYGNHTDKVELRWEEEVKAMATGQLVRTRVLRRHVSGTPQPRLIPHFGYVSLFPLLMKLLPTDSDVLGAMLAHIRDERLLWTPYGLRSLSLSSPLYNKYNTEHDGPYWRGPVWVNINYLALGALKHYSLTQQQQQPSPHAQRAGEVYAELRGNVLANVLRRYEESGYVWEQYVGEEGQGKGSHPFTGWTALVLLIMAEMY
eukprot:jgi/Chlat1/3173/Chrsp22S03407